MPEFWDFNEEKNYNIIEIDNYKYKVLNIYKNNNDAAIILHQIRLFINKICQYLYDNYNSIIQLYDNPNLIKYIDCFLSIHPYNYLLSEMQLNTQFEGLNKPKQLYKCNKYSLGKDKYLKAKKRDIFLKLRKNNGDFKSYKLIIELVIHEITHTMCNHVTWRDDNHHLDFKFSENLLKYVVKQMN